MVVNVIYNGTLVVVHLLIVVHACKLFSNTSEISKNEFYIIACF